MALAENLAYFGNPLAFTNAAVQPKRLAYRLIADSNIDWGQSREGIARTLARRGAGAHQPRPAPRRARPQHVDLNAVAGVFDFERHRWVRENLEPGGHFGHTYLCTRSTPGPTTASSTRARRLRPEPWTDAACPAATVLEHHGPGERLPFTLDTPPRAGDGFVVCVETRRGMDFGLRVGKGLDALRPPRRRRALRGRHA